MDKYIYKLDLNVLYSYNSYNNENIFFGNEDKNIYKLDVDVLYSLYDKDVNSYKIDDNKKDDYQNTIEDILAFSKSINLNHSSSSSSKKSDGRIESAIKEEPFLKELKRLLLDKNPDYDVIICDKRCSCDIIINSIRINLKLTDCKTSDNSVNKAAIYYSITGDSIYPYSSTWNDFLEKLVDAKLNGKIKKERDIRTEYHYLVKNKVTGDVLLKSIFDIHKYISNPSNDLQINWKNEFKNIDYKLDHYHKKIQSLLECIQESVKKMIERNKKFAESELSLLFL